MGLESYSPYDAYGMRELAASLQKQAQTLGTAASEIDAASSGMTFDGPAGDRVRQRLSSVSRSLNGDSSSLQQAAGAVLTAAQQVDDFNARVARHNADYLASLPPTERKLIEINS
jgi:N-acetylglutamate synthase/N-acetylornithine aminotransferase